MVGRYSSARMETSDQAPDNLILRLRANAGKEALVQTEIDSGLVLGAFMLLGVTAYCCHRLDRSGDRAGAQLLAASVAAGMRPMARALMLPGHGGGKEGLS